MAADRKLEEHLKEAGKKLLVPPSSLYELLLLLDHLERFLSRVEQSPGKSMLDTLLPLTGALAGVEFSKHSNVDVRVAVASCIHEIVRITAPDAPYDDDKMKDVFQLIVSSFKDLHDKSSRSYNTRVMILETMAKVRSCVVMLDLECDGLIAEMFQLFLGTIRDFHPGNVFLSMETIMTLVVEESEGFSSEILAPLLASVKKDNQDALPISVKLAEKVFQNCADKLKPYLQSQVIQSLDARVHDSSLHRNEENPSDDPAVLSTIDMDDHFGGTRDLRYEYQACHCGKNATIKIVDFDEPSKGMLYFECSVCNFWEWCNPIGRGACDEVSSMEKVGGGDEDILELLADKIDLKMDAVDKKIGWLMVFVVGIAMYMMVVAIFVAVK